MYILIKIQLQNWVESPDFFTISSQGVVSLFQKMLFLSPFCESQTWDFLSLRYQDFWRRPRLLMTLKQILEDVLSISHMHTQSQDVFHQTRSPLTSTFPRAPGAFPLKIGQLREVYHHLHELFSFCIGLSFYFESVSVKAVITRPL